MAGTEAIRPRAHIYRGTSYSEGHGDRDVKARLPVDTLREPERVLEMLESAAGIDELDISIILILQENGRASFNEIAKRLGVSVATVSKRVRALEERGIIKGYAAVISCENLGFTENLWLMVHTKPGADVDSIGKQISGLIGVKCVYSIYADFDLLVHICCATQEEIAATLQAIGKIRDVVRVTKMSVCSKIKEEFKIVL